MKLGFMGAAALIVAHVAGMIDLVALPVWVGALQERFGFSLQQAGGLVTVFLLGAVLASAGLAPRLNRLNQRIVAVIGYGLAAAAFAAASGQTGFGPLAGLHLVAGVGVGAGLSMVHGAIGRSEKPHRLFALAGIAIGLFALVFLGGVPQLMMVRGGSALFEVFALVMGAACLVSGLFFKNPPSQTVADADRTPFSRAVWFLILGVSLMTFNQAMVFSYVEVIGGARGFAKETVLAVLIALGLVNLIFPAPLAAVLENRLSAFKVVQTGPIVQGVLAVIVTSATFLPLWAPAAAVFVAVQIFTHTFAFGLLARLETSGRAVAATPAMLMIGAALGPFIGGALSQNLGFEILGLAGVVVALAAALCFRRARAAS